MTVFLVRLYYLRLINIVAKTQKRLAPTRTDGGAIEGHDRFSFAKGIVGFFLLQQQQLGYPLLYSTGWYAELPIILVFVLLVLVG